MTAARPCLGDLVAGLVDGELDHQARERVQSHLVGCAGCRAERDAQFQLKARLHGDRLPPVSADLTARLLRLAAAEENPTVGPSAPARAKRFPARSRR